MHRFLTLLVVVGSITGCTRNYITTPTQPSSSVNSVNQSDVKIQFRVSGNANSVRVRYSNERDGLVQTVTTLPFFTSFSSTSSNLFLSLEVTPISFSAITDFPFLNAQIFVNGDLFREASSTSFLLNTISVDGTWRR